MSGAQAEVVGPLSGSGKKAQWPCRLWTSDGDAVVESAEKWFLRNKQLEGRGVGTLKKGARFFCTLRSDAGTTPEPGARFLYNPTLPRKSSK